MEGVTRVEWVLYVWHEKWVSEWSVTFLPILIDWWRFLSPRLSHAEERGVNQSVSSGWERVNEWVCVSFLSGFFQPPPPSLSTLLVIIPWISSILLLLLLFPSILSLDSIHQSQRERLWPPYFIFFLFFFWFESGDDDDTKVVL